MSRLVFTTAITLVLIVTLGGTARSGPADAGDDLRRLVSWMTGSFSNEEQAAADTGLLDVRSHLVEVWPERQDAFWIYVEQAMGDNPDRPYRQRVYRVAQSNDGTFECAVYVFENPLRFAGRWKDERLLEPLTADSLTEMVGCSVFYRIDGDSAFVGNTVAGDCRNNVRGAAYITSEVIVKADRVATWDRGFYSNSEPAWEALTNGYVLRRISPQP
ncbi:MAG: chromophore lyase CpcT/CpeT [Candidatus Zixiibacteriota bacterium]|nr:MAG: chromophore lyase CpcT/CpeT [candidate division Zixibacteria bacterium]